MEVPGDKLALVSTRVAWIGTGHIHMPGFSNEVLKRGVECAGVWDHDANRAEKNAAKLGGPVKSIAELVGDGSVDGFVVCSETVYHLDLVKQVVGPGKPIFIEKPMGFDAEQSIAICKILEGQKIAFQTGYGSRGRAAYRALRDRVNEGFFGQITRVRASNCHGGALAGWFDGEWRWMADRSLSGVGAFGDIGTHALDVLLWIFGDVTAVTGVLSPGTHRYPGCEETGEALLKFSSGAIGTLTAAWDDVADPVKLQVSGTKGHATLGADLLLAGPDGRLEKAELGEDVPAGFGGFLDHLAGKSVELVSPREAANRDIVMDAIYRGAESESWINVQMLDT